VGQTTTIDILILHAELSDAPSAVSEAIFTFDRLRGITSCMGEGNG